MKMKETLNLGKTKFPMRGKLPTKEPERQKEWEENKVYERRLKQNEGHDTFILHDGPPYANGNIHIGHAMNKISKDIIVRSKAMQGYYAPYIPGWDTHGLPIEQAVTNSGVDRKQMSVAEFRKICAEYAKEQVAQQREDFKRLGVAGEWEHPYLSLDKEFEAQEIRVFGKMVAAGLIYQGNKPVYWSPSSESTLAEAEVEYKDVESYAIYVAFPLKDGKGLLPEDSELVIWTTTPWTIPSNLGISVHPDFDYSVVAVNGHHYVVASELLEKVSETLGWEDYEVVQHIFGREMDRMVAKHPFYDRESLVMCGRHVTAEDGTGLVHTAPGHGDDDYTIGMEYDLPILSPINEQGHFTEEAPGFEGLFYAKGNEKSLELLKEKGALLHESTFMHSYPHDWRTKKPVIFRATPQWFCSVDKIRERTLTAINDEVHWWHPSGQRRIYNMIQGRGDWVISRQRVWGVPLPIFYAEDGTPIMTEETINHVADLFEEYGSNVWFEREAKDLLPEGFTHPASPNGEFTKEKDIMDVWFDSGSSHAGVLGSRENLSFPADLYLEGSDQYRGWFNSSLLTSIAVNDQAPYREVLSQGFVNDGEGRKMSKSIGNTVSPNDVAKQRGAEILRLWVASVDTQYDVRISDEILGQVAESYRKIRNTIRFMLSNISDFEPAKHAVAYDDLEPIDQFIMNELNRVNQKVIDAYNHYDFNTVVHSILNFLTITMSSFYIDYSKDVVYIERKDDPARRNMQTVMYKAARDLTILLTPILVHTTEEIWQYLDEAEEYVQLANFPEAETYANHDELYSLWPAFLAFRQNVNKSLEEARNQKIIGKSLSAKLSIYADGETKQMLDQVGEKLDTYLMVSQLEIKDFADAPAESDEFEGFKLMVSPAEGEVCERCRKTLPSVGTIEAAPMLCQRCADIVINDFPEALEAED